MPPKLLPSNSAHAELRRLGEHIAIARKLRRLTIRHVAEAASVAQETIRRLEQGEPGVSVGTLAMVLLVFGESGRLENLLAPPTDDIGMILRVNNLPKRVREKGKKRQSVLPGENHNDPISDGKYTGF